MSDPEDYHPPTPGGSDDENQNPAKRRPTTRSKPLVLTVEKGLKETLESISKSASTSKQTHTEADQELIKEISKKVQMTRKKSATRKRKAPVEEEEEHDEFLQELTTVNNAENHSQGESIDETPEKIRVAEPVNEWPSVEESEQPGSQEKFDACEKTGNKALRELASETETATSLLQPVEVPVPATQPLPKLPVRTKTKITRAVDLKGKGLGGSMISVKKARETYELEKKKKDTAKLVQEHKKKNPTALKNGNNATAKPKITVKTIVSKKNTKVQPPKNNNKIEQQKTNKKPQQPQKNVIAEPPKKVNAKPGKNQPWKVKAGVAKKDVSAPEKSTPDPKSTTATVTAKNIGSPKPNASKVKLINSTQALSGSSRVNDIGKDNKMDDAIDRILQNLRKPGTKTVPLDTIPPDLHGARVFCFANHTWHGQPDAETTMAEPNIESFDEQVQHARLMCDTVIIPSDPNRKSIADTDVIFLQSANLMQSDRFLTIRNAILNNRLVCARAQLDTYIERGATRVFPRGHHYAVLEIHPELLPGMKTILPALHGTSAIQLDPADSGLGGFFDIALCAWAFDSAIIKNNLSKIAETAEVRFVAANSDTKNPSSNPAALLEKKSTIGLFREKNIAAIAADLNEITFAGSIMGHTWPGQSIHTGEGFYSYETSEWAMAPLEAQPPAQKNAVAVEERSATTSTHPNQRSRSPRRRTRSPRRRSRSRERRRASPPRRRRTPSPTYRRHRSPRTELADYRDRRRSRSRERRPRTPERRPRSRERRLSPPMRESPQRFEFERLGYAPQGSQPVPLTNVFENTGIPMGFPLEIDSGLPAGMPGYEVGSWRNQLPVDQMQTIQPESRNMYGHPRPKDTPKFSGFSDMTDGRGNEPVPCVPHARPAVNKKGIGFQIRSSRQVRKPGHHN